MRKILITGAAKRLGRIMALGLARADTMLVLHYRNSGQEAAASPK